MYRLPRQEDLPALLALIECTSFTGGGGRSVEGMVVSKSKMGLEETGLVDCG